jgi:SAM-dependent methyltransferase
MAERQQRLVFGEDAELYDRARPSYPDALLDEVVRLAGSSALVLEVGCGTGKATVQLAARGLVGTAVEADPKMAAVARRNLAGATGWTVDVSDFETWERSGGPRAFDLVCSAQAWHWIDPEVRFHKAHGLLRTGGWLALWWNRPAEVSSPVVDAVSRTYDAIAPDLRAGARGIGSKERPAPDVPPGL